jgi:type IV secretion system protein VirB6
VRVCMAAGLTFLIMRQVMPMSAGLASGLALSTFGVVSAALAWGLGRASRTGGQWTRSAGGFVGRGAAAGARRLGSRWRENTIRPQPGRG